MHEIDQMCNQTTNGINNGKVGCDKENGIKKTALTPQMRLTLCGSKKPYCNKWRCESCKMMPEWARPTWLTTQPKNYIMKRQKWNVNTIEWLQMQQNMQRITRVHEQTGQNQLPAMTATTSQQIPRHPFHWCRNSVTIATQFKATLIQTLTQTLTTQQINSTHCKHEDAICEKIMTPKNGIMCGNKSKPKVA